MSRNVIDEQTATTNRDSMGAYTYNSFPPDGWDGTVFTIAALRLGDHAHLEVFTGEYVPQPFAVNTVADHRAHAGYLCMAWRQWLLLRDIVLAPHDCIRVAEVERPTLGQLETHLPPPHDGDIVARARRNGEDG